MIKRIGFGLLAAAGIIFSVFMIYYGSKQPPEPSIPFQPPIPPYEQYIAAEGITETVFTDIYIGVPFGDLITNVYINVGDIVTKDTPLFKIDTRQPEAQLRENEARLVVAELEYQQQKTDLSFYEKLQDASAVSKEAYANAMYSTTIAQANVEVARAAVGVSKTFIERSTIRAPINGEVLQLDIRVGEFANVNPFTQKPLIIFGDTRLFHVRISINEEDAWRFVPGSTAMAYVRGNSAIQIPLEFVYVEPYIVPKKDLAGSDTERIDTRVLQVVYAFEKDSYPVYYGQILDVFIEANSGELP